jgi:PDZ domain-containing secreted protein
MKKLYCFLSIIVFFTLSSCKKDQGPIPVAEQFLSAIQERDYDKASEFGTKETVKLLKQFEKIEELNGEVMDEKLNKITILSEDIQGKNAKVYFKEEGNELEQKITLVKVKEDGSESWKVAMKKEEMNVMGVQE